MIPTIETVALNKQFNSFTALASLNLKIEGSKCVGFLGPNGAGKTTTFKMLTDLIKPTSGCALINGIDTHTHKKGALASVGSLIETPEIYPSLTPREALSMVAKIRGVPSADLKARIEDVVEEVQMNQWIDKRIGKFSKGMKQRICLASVLLSNPTVILLDEPTVGLDPRGVCEIRDIIKSLKNKNCLIFMSSHILSEVSDVCDEVAIIDQGKLIAYDSLSNLTSKFSEEETTVEVGFQTKIEDKTVKEAIGKLSNIVSAKRVDDRRFEVAINGGLEAQKELLRSLVQLDLGVVSYREASTGLEDVYLKLIKDTR